LKNEHKHDLNAIGKKMDGQHIRRRIEFRLPLTLTREYWQRHKLSLDDISWILECTAPVYVWQCAMLFNISIANAAVKDCSATSEYINYGGKATAIQKLLKLLAKEYPEADNSTSVFYLPTPRGNISSMELEHTYFPIPFHTVDEHGFKTFQHEYHLAWKHGVENRQQWFSQPILHYTRVWKWCTANTTNSNTNSNDCIYVVPLRLVESTPPCIFMGRVVPYTWYSKWYPCAPCISDMPDIVMIQDEIWCVKEDVFYVYVGNDSPSKKSVQNEIKDTS